MPEITMTKSQFEDFKNNLANGIANDFVNALVRRVPVDTGLLRNSIAYRKIKNGVEIYMAEYGKYVEFGTPPHIIRPKNAKALRWEVQTLGPRGGKNKNEVFAKQVNHPGTRPQPFIRPALRNDLPRIIVDNIRRHAQ